MSGKIASIDALAAASARLAQSQLALAQRDLRSLRDSLAGLNHAIAAPVIKTPRHTIKSTRSGSNLLGYLDIGAGVLNDAFSFTDARIGGSVTIGGIPFSYSSGGSFAVSAAQSAGAGLADLALGQRIR